MARKRIAKNLHQLTVRQVQSAGEDNHTDGGGLLLRVRGGSASWVFRYTAVVRGHGPLPLHYFWLTACKRCRESIQHIGRASGDTSPAAGRP